MKNTGLQDGVDIDVMLPESTLHQYSKMEHKNEYHYPRVKGKTPTSKKSSVYILASPSINSTNIEVC